MQTELFGELSQGGGAMPMAFEPFLRPSQPGGGGRGKVAWVKTGRDELSDGGRQRAFRGFQISAKLVEQNVMPWGDHALRRLFRWLTRGQGAFELRAEVDDQMSTAVLVSFTVLGIPRIKDRGPRRPRAPPTAEFFGVGTF